jgi:hypothetical protein
LLGGDCLPRRRSVLGWIKLSLLHFTLNHSVLNSDCFAHRLFSRNSRAALRLRLGRSGAVLLVGLLLLGGGPLVQSVGGQVWRGPTTAAASPNVKPLAATSATNSVSTQPLQPLPSSLAGVNGTTWEDNSDGTCSGCTYQVFLTPAQGPPNTYFLAIWYLTDPACPPAAQTELVNLDIGGNGTMLNDNPGYTHMELCTRASNTIVQDCGQDQIWYVDNFTLTVTQSSISGEYQSQYWTWDTDANGAITNCRIDYNYTQAFSLTPVFSTATQTSSTASSSAATPQQSNGPANSPPSHTSSRSSTNSSSTSTSTHAGASGYLGVEIIAAAVVAVLVVLAGVSWVFLLRRRK